VFAPDGRRLTGDIAFRPDIVKPDGGGVWFRPELTSREGGRPTYMRTKAKQLSDGNVLVIARDVDEMTRLRNYMLAGIAWSGVVALIGGLGFGALCSTVELRDQVRAAERGGGNRGAATQQRPAYHCTG